MIPHWDFGIGLAIYTRTAFLLVAAKQGSTATCGMLAKRN
jgi:hypothetical protein